MPVSVEVMTDWCRTLLGASGQGPAWSLEGSLAAIPRLDTLVDIPSGTPVLVRGDVDAKPGPTIGEGDVRLRSMVDTLRFGVERGWKQIVFGHIGRKPEGSLAKVASRLGELLEIDVPLVADWLDELNMKVTDEAVDAVERCAPGGVVMLENTRKYEIERVLWKAKPDDVPKLAPQLAKLATAMADSLASVYVNEALSAGSLDASTAVVPAGMSRVALGKYVAGEFEGPMLRCLETELVIFSGLKTDKLDDLQAMIDRGKIRYVFTAGSLAMALLKARAKLDGGEFTMGVAEDPAHKDKPYYIPPERIEQARRMLAEGRAKGIEFVMPVDFVLADGNPADEIGATGQQFDVGPKTSALFDKKVGEFLDAARSRGGRPPVVFHNGVFGMFEDPRFEDGTRRFIAQLKRMKDAGAEVYVGGGEGGTALERYGQPDWVTHCFTAGGTVLAALGNEPIPYLAALDKAAR